MVECVALEMRSTGNRTGGSNPSLSAITHNFDRFGFDPQGLSVRLRLLASCRPLVIAGGKGHRTNGKRGVHNG